MRPVNILIVDDTHTNLLFLSECFEEEGYKSFLVKSGKQALDFIENNAPPDLILLDIMMPEMDGFEVCKRIKQNKKVSDVPVIFLTADIKNETKIEGFRLGAVDYITKPFQTDELLARVKAHLNLRQKENELIEAISISNKKQKQIELITDNIPVHIAQVRKDLKYLFANRQYFNLLGKQPNEIIGKHVKEIVGKDTYENIKPYLKEVLYGKPVSFETGIYNKYGKKRYLQSNYVPEIIENKIVGFYVFAYDITEKVKAKQDLIKAKEVAEKNEKEIKQILDAINDPVYLLDAQYRIVFMNKAIANKIGYEKIGAKCYKSIYNFNEKCKWCKFDELLETKKLIEYEIKIPDKEKYFRVRNILLKDNIKLTIFQDITKQKKAEKEILQTIITTEENERTRFAQEIHDGIGPLLAAIKHYTQWISQEKDENEREIIKQKTIDLINEAETTVRRTSLGLSSYILQKFGLNDAIQAFAKKIMESTKIAIQIETNKPQISNKVVETTLYRVLTELINNTLKHAKASEIKIRIYSNKNKLLINYTDNGIGFDANQIENSFKGIGLYNMKSRIKALNGSFDMQSSKDKGIQVCIELANQNI